MLDDDNVIAGGAAEDHVLFAGVLEIVRIRARRRGLSRITSGVRPLSSTGSALPQPAR